MEAVLTRVEPRRLSSDPFGDHLVVDRHPNVRHLLPASLSCEDHRGDQSVELAEPSNAPLSDFSGAFVRGARNEALARAAIGSGIAQLLAFLRACHARLNVRARGAGRRG